MKKLSGLILLLGICTSPSQVLYNINFNGPTQPANQLVVTGSPPDHVSSIIFGSPMVVPSFGALTDQPLRLDMAGNDAPNYYDQIQLNMPTIHPPAIDLSFDFTSSGVVGGGGGLTVLFDTPSVRNLYLDNHGVISAFSPSFGTTTFGSFADGEEFRFGVHLDLVTHQMSVFKNGALLGTAPFFPDDYIRSIRFNFGANFIGGGLDESAVGIDNLVVSVPEPGCLSVVATGLGLVVLQRRLRVRRA